MGHMERRARRSGELAARAVPDGVWSGVGIVARKLCKVRRNAHFEHCIYCIGGADCQRCGEVVKLFFARVRRAASWRVHVYSVGWSEHVGRNGDGRDRERWPQAAPRATDIPQD